MALLAALVNLIVLVSPSVTSAIDTVGTLPQVSDYQDVLKFIPPGMKLALPVGSLMVLGIVAMAQFARPRKMAGYDYAPRRISLFVGFLIPGLAVTVAGPWLMVLALALGTGLGIWAWSAQSVEQQRLLARLVLDAIAWLVVAGLSYGLALFFAYAYLSAQFSVV